MIRKIVYTLIFTILCINVNAQNQDNDPKKAEKARIAQVRKDLDQAKTALKTGANLDKSENALRKLLENEQNMRDMRIHTNLQETILKQYAQVNEKAFLKQKYDSAQVFLLSQRLFAATQVLDSIDALPNAKGVSAPKYRNSNIELLGKFVGNIYSGIVYFVNKQKWNEAISLTDLYLSIPDWRMFDQLPLRIDDVRKAHAAYLALYSAYNAKRNKDAFKYADEALNYESRRESTMLYLTEMASTEKDTANYVKYLEMGMASFPTSNYFFPRLIDLYNSDGDMEKALDVTAKVIEADSCNVEALVTRQTLLLNLERYDECIKLGENTLAKEDELFGEDDAQYLAELNYNTALSYYNQSLTIGQTVSDARKRRAATNELYAKCRPYMERYRTLAPKEKERWKPVLYTIYLNLNMGKEFAEIEKL